MTIQEIGLLVAQWKPDPPRPILVDPWKRLTQSFGQQVAMSAHLKDRPDFGWALAERLATPGRTSTLLKQPEYRWIRATLQFLTGYRHSSTLS